MRTPAAAIQRRGVFELRIIRRWIRVLVVGFVAVGVGVGRVLGCLEASISNSKSDTALHIRCLHVGQDALSRGTA